ncbi:LuxR C-terminal-related transcriptional regulator [Rhodococcus sp. SJ-3]|uniref:helix-turn-helix transcriptional regulator n=1 Tax=Rhodococcus sp. SJ-3 TaxID=3454628 RepID=UPI003F7B086B
MSTTASSLLRPRDGDALRSELRRTASHAQVPVVFAGEVKNGHLHLSEFLGTRTNGLSGVVVPPRAGLGGRALDEARPITVADYGSASSITHHFDRPVLSEGLRSILAVPVVVGGAARAVLYGAVRERSRFGDRVVSAFVHAATRLASEITVRDEVDRRVAMLGYLCSDTKKPIADTEVREIHAELRTLAQNVDDAGLGQQLRALSDRLASTLVGKSSSDTVVTLSTRETDVLSYVALGCTNAEIARRLAVGSETVKSYLRSAMNKLDVHSRHEAVVVARKLGLLP